MIREDLGQPIERLFLEFDPTPLAAASIGQVHRADAARTAARSPSRCSGPNAPRQIESDIELLEQAARLVRERVRALDFIDTREIVDEFARSIRQELDYRQEGRNAEAFHRNFAGHPHVAVPRTYWSYTRERVLTLEYLDGVQLADLELDAWTLEQRKPPRLPDRRDLADDDLPPRPLPRRPAPGEHPRARARADRARRLRARRAS